MKIRRKLTALSLLLVLSGTAACGTNALDAAQSGSSSPTSAASAATGTGTSTEAAAPARGGGPGGGVEVDSVTTEAQLIELVQDSYGDASLDRHRGHRPVEDVLDAVLKISHAELHTRMEAGQNLAAVATDLGIDPQTLLDALVASRTAAVDNVLASGAISEAEAEQYRQALEDAFSFRINWNGSDATPTFSGLAA